jgi:DNA-binding LacI/PurR family transcriptional regulator
MARRALREDLRTPKYQQLIQTLSRDILSGKYPPGRKFPSESALVRQFHTSRITIGRALRELARRGLVERVAGSGTYVRNPQAGSRLFGLLIPDLGATDIFEPMCQGIAGAPEASHHALLWGHTVSDAGSTEQDALDLCEEYVRRKVDGVFFAPFERAPQAGRTNRAIVARLERAGIPIVLLDRCVMPYPERCRHDLVGIDNRRAGYAAAAHLVRYGARRVSFVAPPGSISTVEARIAGFREAAGADSAVHRVDPSDQAAIRHWMAKARRPLGFVCSNDRTAGLLMQTLLGLGVRIPQEVRIVGIDDVGYAGLLPVPLTTIHQPCREIGEAAMAAMLARVERPNTPARDVLLEFRMVVRKSCGA